MCREPNNTIENGKKPTTQLPSKAMDRGNHYWQHQTVKALGQAEKYLVNAERKADALEADIKRERDVDVGIVRPKAVLIVGHSKQRTTKKMHDDFRVLRESLENVEIVLYDELLTRFKNQKNKIYVDPDIKLIESAYEFYVATLQVIVAPPVVSGFESCPIRPTCFPGPTSAALPPNRRWSVLLRIVGAPAPPRPQSGRYAASSPRPSLGARSWT